MKREREREQEHLEAFAPVRGKNGDLQFLPFNCPPPTGQAGESV
jgi:hypothetical protein